MSITTLPPYSPCGANQTVNGVAGLKGLNRGMGAVRGLAGGLGDTTCPAGYKVQVSYGDTVGSVLPSYSCVPALEESVWCKWLGWGCNTPAASTPAPAAPQTQDQMTVPGEWTPDQSSTQTNADYQAMIDAYNAQNPGGVGEWWAALYEGGSAVGDAISSRTTWLALGAVAAVGLLVAVRR